MDRFTAQRAIIAKTNEVLALARSLYPGYVHPDPTILFDLRGRSVGGTALGTRQLRFNLDWAVADLNRFLNIIVPHEVAHIVDEALYPAPAPVAIIRRGRIRRKPVVQHGPTWVRICKALGGDGERTCNIALESGVRPQKARRTRQYRYLSVSGGECWIGPTHHKKIQERGDIMIGGRPAYALNNKVHGRILKSGFTGECRLAA